MVCQSEMRLYVRVSILCDGAGERDAWLNAPVPLVLLESWVVIEYATQFSTDPRYSQVSNCKYPELNLHM